LGALHFLSVIHLCLLSIPFPLAPVRLANFSSSKSIKIRVGNIFIKCISMLLLRGLVANPNEDNAINVNRQDQGGVAKACVGPTHRSKGSSRIASIGLEHPKVKATRSPVKLVESKSTQESREQPMNQPCFLASFFLNLGGEIPVKGVRFITP
jgi:hypothetical protein